MIAGALFLVQFFTSDKIAPKPRVGIAQTSMPNAFAVGRSPRTATVCATTGILELLSPAELEAVLAHELTHVQKRDVLVMTIASFFASIASFIVQMGFCFGGAFGGALISALLKISGTMQQIPQQDLRAANSELAAFYIFPPKAKQTFATLFSTHPPLEARIAELQRLEAQLQGSACGLPRADAATPFSRLWTGLSGFARAGLGA